MLNMSHIFHLKYNIQEESIYIIRRKKLRDQLFFGIVSNEIK